MVSTSGHLVTVFNGEIYNHLDLRSELEKDGISGMGFNGWRGHSDTETLIVAIEHWGLEKVLEIYVLLYTEKFLQP